MKWDGVRALLYWDGERTIVRSRSGNDATSRYPELADFSADVPVVLDGEIVALDESGRPSFERLQRRMNLQSPVPATEAMGTVDVSYVVFDVLHYADPTVDLPLEARREVLEGIRMSPAMVRSQVVEGDPAPLWEFVRERGIEGIVSKRRDSRYRPGRSSLWRKITSFRHVRAVVGGFTVGEGGRASTFGALLLGLWDGPALRWIGSAGTGFSERALVAIRTALDEMTVPASPFSEPPAVPGEVRYVVPGLVAAVQYKEWTAAGRLRAPSFKGFTDDDPASQTWESEGPGAAG